MAKLARGVNDIRALRPALVPQMVHPELATEFTIGSSEKLWWRCPIDGHLDWQARVKERARARKPQGCPACYHLPVEGVNDIETTHPTVSRQLVNQKLAKTLSAGSNENVTWSCDNAQHLTWDTQVKNRTRLLNPTGCPYCSGNLVVPDVTDLGSTHPTLTAGMRYPELAKTLSAGMSQYVVWKCPNGHPDWRAKVCDRTKAHRPTGCKLCANYGFDPSKPAWVYLLRSDDGRAFKVGLTNNWRRRHEEHKRQGFSTKVKARRFQDGAIAQTFEKELKAGIKEAGWKPARTAKDMRSGGFTETFNKRDSGELSSFEDLWDALLLRRILAVL